MQCNGSAIRRPVQAGADKKAAPGTGTATAGETGNESLIRYTQVVPKQNYYGLILAGGRGTRFWPRSRRAKAKQVLSFFGERTLIQQTVERLSAVLPPERIWIITNDLLRDEIIRQLPEVPKKQILAEPAQRNTAPCIALAAHIIQSIDRDAVMGVFPADHIITKPARYAKLLKPAYQSAAQGNIAVLGIEPRWAETGYGYIEFGKAFTPGKLQPVVSFREKPVAATAKKFVAAKRFYWNAGMFFWKTSVLLEAMRDFQPKTWTLLAALPPFSSPKFRESMARTFPLCENISIDYAVLEKAKNVVGIPAADIGWNDVGSWDAVYELLNRDAEANASVSQSLTLDSTEIILTPKASSLRCWASRPDYCRYSRCTAHR
ncbi:MAG: mannose-1-phosphate guanylyltransferase [Bryobacteraceae bacterium]